jgi:cytochrome c553
MKNSAFLAAFTFVLATFGCSSLERSRDLSNPAVTAKTLAQQECSNCHGVDGNSVSPQYPRLAGQQKAYLVSQLRSFRGHQRSDPPGPEMMWGITRGLTDDQINGLAEYFNKQTPLPNAAVDPGLVPLGKQIYENGIAELQTPACHACHGPNAEGMATFPRLANQHEDYLMNQLHVFQATDFRAGTPMKEVTHLLTPEHIRAVAAYLQGLSSGSRR